MNKILPITVGATDILDLKATYYQVNGNVAFAFNIDELSLKVIFLRTILQCFGDYLITGYEEFKSDDEYYGIYFTDLPVDEFIDTCTTYGVAPTVEDYE